jgi:mannosyltransferase
MPEEMEVLTGRARTAAGIVIALIVACGIFLRFFTHSAMWLDEALTVDRSSLPIRDIATSLKQDGAPPLYYYLLHYWMELFGQSDLAIRSLSGVIGVATLPVAWFAANRFGGRVAAWITLVLLASAPYAVYYSTEARMYALDILLTGCGYLALSRALTRPRPGNLVAIGVVTAGLLYTQYWSLYLVATVGIWLLGSAWLDRRRQTSSENQLESRHALPAFFAVAVGCLLFVPWLPTFFYQSQHTGTPWAKPPNFGAIVSAVTGFADNQGSLQVGTTQGRLLAVIYLVLFALAIFGIGRSGRLIDLDLRTRPRARGMAFAVLGTLFLAIAGGILTGSAFAPRYASVVFLPLLLLVGLGFTTLFSLRLRLVVVAAAVAAGLFASFQNIDTLRTQAPQVAAVINARAHPGDVIAFCPDQLGPAVYRVTDTPSRYRMTTFPRGTSPRFVDWVDYKKTVQSENPTAFATKLAAETGSANRIWLVWEPGYQTYDSRCEDVVNALLGNPRFQGYQWVSSNGFKYYEPMDLTEYSPVPK